MSAGLSFIVRVPTVPEQLQDGEQAEAYVRRLAREKAVSVDRGVADLVLGADTVVVVENCILEKPRDHPDATRMLKLLSGREHQVITGICLRGPKETIVDSASTRVRFASMTEREIADYVATGEPMDKAGAYAIQGAASRFIQSVEGCYFNVVGLPVSLVYSYLKDLRVPL